MFRRVLLPLALMVLGPFLARAADETELPPAPNPAPNLAPNPVSNVAPDLASLNRQLQTLSQHVTSAMEQVRENGTQIGQLRSELLDIRDQINEELAKQQQILDAISETDSQGQQIPRLSAAMESPEFRSDMKSAVNESLDRSGTLRITNRTGEYRQIYVNRVQQGVAAGETLTLKVPTGTVSTQLDGEELKTWTVNAPQYEQGIEIVPRSTPTYVARPVVVSSPPIVASPPLFSPLPAYYDPLPLWPDSLYYWP